MSYAAYQWALDIETTLTCKAVLLSLANRADDNARCWPSLDRIGKDTCMSERAARNAVLSLIAQGLIERQERPGTSPMFTIKIGATPAPRAAHPGTTCRQPRHHVPPTPAPRAPESSRIINEPSLNHHGELLTPAINRTANAETKPKRESVPLVLTKTKTEPLSAFDEFWKHYPRKVGKDAARKAFAAAQKRGATLPAMLQAISRTRWSADPEYIKHPSGWLNAGRWQDEPNAPPPANIVTFARPKTHTERVQDRFAAAAIPVQQLYGHLWDFGPASQPDGFEGETLDGEPVALEG